jgi:hypothetical protein
VRGRLGTQSQPFRSSLLIYDENVDRQLGKGEHPESPNSPQRHEEHEDGIAAKRLKKHKKEALGEFDRPMRILR